VDNQHKKIKGYRDLVQEEIDLMNLIKQQEAILHCNLAIIHGKYVAVVRNKYKASKDEELEQRKLLGKDLQKQIETFTDLWKSAETSLMTGFMLAVRAIAQPGPVNITDTTSVWCRLSDQVIQKLKDGDPDRDLVVVSDVGERRVMKACDLFKTWEIHKNQSIYTHCIDPGDLPILD
jgi:hypothetical protein